MDTTDLVIIVASVVSPFLVGYLAWERGRSQRRWASVAVMIGPLAIPLFYLVTGASALGKMIFAPRHQGQQT
jgi:hypothetical protein